MKPKPSVRRHDLDALRAFAMLLGIVLHATLSFIEGFWPVRDIAQDDIKPDENPFAFILLAIHGFRMPLFFLLSGFFTALLWRRRGQGALLSHRARRVALPLLVSVLTIIPLIRWLSERAFDQRTDTFGIIYAQLSKVGVEGLDSWLTSLDHLWFLWFLIWMVAGFALVALLLEKVTKRSASGDSALGRATTIWLWAMPVVSLMFGLFSKTGLSPIWGPHTSTELLPDFWVLGYYGAFFAFGALLYHARKRNGAQLRDSFGGGWPWALPVAVVALLVGLNLTYEAGRDAWVPATLVETIHTWTAAYALIGLFTVLFSQQRYWVRYISDASYWMYIAHLPLVIFLQDIVDQWNVPSGLKFLAICLVCFGILLLLYRFVVRYSPIGWMLNGKLSGHPKASIR